MAERKPNRMSVEEFLAWEQEQDLRYELVDGLPMAMTGGTEAHDNLRLAIASEFRRQLDRRRCRPHIDLKVVCPTGQIRYPDVQINCQPGQNDRIAVGNPIVVVEVLSPSTKAIDFLGKLKDYESVASIEMYLIFWQDEPKAAVFLRAGRSFQRTEDPEGLDAVVRIPSLDLTLRFADLYDWLPPAGEEAAG